MKLVAKINVDLDVALVQANAITLVTAAAMEHVSIVYNAMKTLFTNVNMIETVKTIKITITVAVENALSINVMMLDQPYLKIYYLRVALTIIWELMRYISNST